ncbi:MAG: hypothetical protein RL481_843 [Pseudomonadota bacterium]
MKLFVGEDSISATCPAGTDIQALATVFRQSGLWAEVVPGMADLTVKYDPDILSVTDAESQFCALWYMPVQIDGGTAPSITLQVCFSNAPDAELVSAALDIDADMLPDWLCARQYRVVMMGFQPGFAYLEDLDNDDLPDLPRLQTPRQQVAAGSIGFLGKRACIYALDGPGGWPIVGRIAAPLFRRDDASPFLLVPGQIIRLNVL